MSMPLPFEPQPQPPIRVLHARVVTRSGGGPDKTILRSAACFDPAQVAMAAAYLHPVDDPGIQVVCAAARQLRCMLFEVAERGPVDLNAMRQMLSICRDLDINIWHAHDYKTTAMGLLLRRHHPMKLVTTAHGWVEHTWRTRLYFSLEKRLLRYYDHVIAVSEDLAEECARHRVPASRLSYIPNAIDADDYRRATSVEQAKRELGVAPDRLVVGVIGRLSEEKGIDRAIRLIASLKPQFPNVELHLVGEGPHRHELAAVAQQLGVTDAIKWYGWRCDTRRFYEMMDLLLLPSHREGLPNVVLEAMAMGTPVAASRVGGVSDLLDQGNCGVLLDPHATSTWPVLVAPLLIDPSVGQRYARLARQRIEQRFSFTRRMQAVSEVYHRVLNLESGKTATFRRAA